MGLAVHLTLHLTTFHLASFHLTTFHLTSFHLAFHLILPFLVLRLLMRCVVATVAVQATGSVELSGTVGGARSMDEMQVM